MLGAIAGDMIGSIYERNNIKTTRFPLWHRHSTFTDDSVLTIATADCLMNYGDYAHYYRKYYTHYPRAGYGGRFMQWAEQYGVPAYNSWGNGSAMRVSPVAWWYQTEADVLEAAKESAQVTHNHPEGIKGAQAVALAVYMARKNAGKNEILKRIALDFDYSLTESISEIRKWYAFDVSCQGSVPQAIRAFYESESFEEAIRLAISIGGDSDTIACISGAIAEAYYGRVPPSICHEIETRLPVELLKTVSAFYREIQSTHY